MVEEKKREEFLRRSRARTGVAFASWGRSAFRVLCPAVVLAMCAGDDSSRGHSLLIRRNSPGGRRVRGARPRRARGCGRGLRAFRVGGGRRARRRGAREEPGARRRPARGVGARGAGARGRRPVRSDAVRRVRERRNRDLSRHRADVAPHLRRPAGVPVPGKARRGGEGRERRRRPDAGSGPSATALALAGAVRRAHADLLEAREDQRLVDEQIDTWKQIDETIRARYAAGMGTQQDVLRAQSERTRLLQQRRRDQAAEEEAIAELRRLLDLPPDAPVAAAARLIPGAPLDGS